MRRADAGRASAAIPGTGGRAGALARSARYAAAALLLAFAALLALPLQAQAQTVSIGAETDGTGDAEGVEGATIELTVKLSAVSADPVTGMWRYVPGTARSADYGHDGNQNLTIAAGATTATVSVDLVDDTKYEGEESFEVELYNVVGATIGRSRAQITIDVDDSNPDLPSFRVDSTTVDVNEDDGTVTVQVVHDAFTAQDTDITITYETADGTATQPDDYTATSGTLTFPAGSRTTRTVTIPIINDADEEDDETFEVEFGPPSVGAFDSGGAKATVTIEANDPPSADATLSGLALKNAADDSAIDLNETFASGTKSYTVTVANAVDEITVEPASDHNATFAYLNASDTVLTDADSLKTGFQAALAVGANTIKVKVTAEAGDSHTDTYTVVVTRRAMTTTPPAPVEIAVPNNWSLIPTGLSTGDKFRLIFLSSTKTNATSDDIADYNSFIQNRAAAGHTDIQAYSAGFRAVGCTADSDATANTGTTGTGVVIYWLNGAKVADNYGDFYDGSWDDEANDKEEDGTNGRDTSQAGNYPRTGCEHNGTEATFGGSSRGLGAGSVRVGIPNSSATGNGPLSSATNPSPSSTRPMYGLSQVFEVAAAGNTLATGKPSITGAAQAGMTLTAGLGDIADADDLPTSGYTYQWISGGSDIAEATGSSLALASGNYGQKLRVRVSFTDVAGFLESRTSDETLPVAPSAAACPTDAATVWCATLTVGHYTEEEDGFIDVLEAGYEARSGQTAYGSVTGGGAFRHLGVDYTVTALFGVSHENLLLATTPNLPAGGAGLTVHVQTYGGEVDASLAEAEFFTNSNNWGFLDLLLSSPNDPLADTPLIRGIYTRFARILEPTDLGTRVRVRLSYAAPTGPATGKPSITGTAQVGQTLTAGTSGISDPDGNMKAENGDAGLCLHLPVVPGGRRRRDGDYGRAGKGEHLHAGSGGRGQDVQGGGELHRRRGQRRGTAQEQRISGGRGERRATPGGRPDRSRGPPGGVPQRGVGHGVRRPPGQRGQQDAGDGLPCSRATRTASGCRAAISRT